MARSIMHRFGRIHYYIIFTRLSNAIFRDVAELKTAFVCFRVIFPSFQRQIEQTTDKRRLQTNAAAGLSSVYPYYNIGHKTRTSTARLIEFLSSNSYSNINYSEFTSKALYIIGRLSIPCHVNILLTPLNICDRQTVSLHYTTIENSLQLKNMTIYCSVKTEFANTSISKCNRNIVLCSHPKFVRAPVILEDKKEFIDFLSWTYDNRSIL